MPVPCETGIFFLIRCGLVFIVFVEHLGDAFRQLIERCRCGVESIGDIYAQVVAETFGIEWWFTVELVELILQSAGAHLSISRALGFAFDFTDQVGFGFSGLPAVFCFHGHQSIRCVEFVNGQILVFKQQLQHCKSNVVLSNV